MCRHPLRTTRMTSSRPPEGWAKPANAPTATPIHDRPLAKTDVLQITGKSFWRRGGVCDEK